MSLEGGLSRRQCLGGAVTAGALTMLSLPRAAMAPSNVSFRFANGLMMPRQFGPITRMSPLRASSSTCLSNSRPLGPDSRNPAEITIAP